MTATSARLVKENNTTINCVDELIEQESFDIFFLFKAKIQTKFILIGFSAVFEEKQAWFHISVADEYPPLLLASLMLVAVVTWLD